MFIPKWILILTVLLMAGFITWTVLLVLGRNPLPFPDHGSRIFVASSLEGKDAVVDLLAMHGIEERFQSNTSGVNRSIMWDGTIINYSSDEMLRKLDNSTAGIGLVASDPTASANAAADFLRSRGFRAEVVLDVEPELPITYLLTDAMTGTLLNFRKHVIHLPRPK